MQILVTAVAERDEIGVKIASAQTSKHEVMHLQVSHCSAFLATPIIALQYLVAEFSVFGRA